MVGHLALRQESQGLLRRVVGIGDPDDAEELLFDRHGGVAVVDPPFVAVGQGDPLDAGDGRVGQDLARPFAVVNGVPSDFASMNSRGLRSRNRA